MEHGSSADRQLAVYAETGDLKAVVDSLVRETAEGLPA
jgi:carboxylate-amine ligase